MASHSQGVRLVLVSCLLGTPAGSGGFDLPDRQLVVATRRIAQVTRWLANREAAHTSRECVEDRVDLELCEAAPCAHVRTVAEGEMITRVALDPEHVRLVVVPRVAVG